MIGREISNTSKYIIGLGYFGRLSFLVPRLSPKSLFVTLSCWENFSADLVDFIGLYASQQIITVLFNGLAYLSMKQIIGSKTCI